MEFTVSHIYKSRQSALGTRQSVESGFTLVELLVVIATISLLLSILMPSLSKARSMAKRMVCAHNLKQIGLAMHLYLSSSDNTYPCAQDPVYTDPNAGSIWLWMGRGWRSFVEPYLGGNIDVNNPSVLFCPQDPVAEQDYEATSYAYSMAFYHTSEQIDGMECTEKHAEQWDDNLVQESVRQKVFNVAKPSAKILIGEWECNHLRIDFEDRWWCKGWWSEQGSRNYLFADGQVKFIKAEEIREAHDSCPNPNMTIHGIKGIDLPNY